MEYKVNERVKEILEERGFKKFTAFAKVELGLDKSGIESFRQYMNDVREITTDVIQKILARFPNINGDWILTGDGAKYKGGDSITPPVIASLEYEKLVELRNKLRSKQNVTNQELSEGYLNIFQHLQDLIIFLQHRRGDVPQK
jgi:hypothetical protein